MDKEISQKLISGGEEERIIKISSFPIRSKKITTALYMVTDKIPDTDPIRIKTRTLAIDILSELSDTNYFVPMSFMRKNVSGRIRELISLLEIGATVGVLSQMNVNILSAEYKSLENDLYVYSAENLRKEIIVSDEEAESFKDSFLKDKDYTARLFTSNKGQISSTLAGRFQGTEGPGFPRQKETASIGTKSNKKYSFGKVERKNKVLSYFAGGKELNIKDIYVNFPGVSEKTIQRELNSLVSAGTLRRVGEKRWSRYVLV